MANRVGAAPRWGRRDHLIAELRARAEHHTAAGRPGWGKQAQDSADELERGADEVWFAYRYWRVTTRGTLRTIERSALIREFVRTAETLEAGEWPWEAVSYRLALGELRAGASHLVHGRMSYTIIDEDGGEQ